MLSNQYSMGKGANSYGWGLTGKAVLLAVVFMIVKDGVCGKGNSGSLSEKGLEIERKLKLLNKPAVKSIQSEDGDIIDCVDIHKQPALDHPQLKNHTIHMRPGSGMQRTKDKPSSSSLPVLQLWRKRGSCPEGTVPIRRTSKEDLLRASSFEKFGRRTSHFFYHPNTTNSKISFSPNDNHALGLLITEGYRYSGARADISVSTPNVEFDDEYSDSMIFLRGGPYDDFDAIEAGWGVNPLVYGDRHTRLSGYWTSDASQKTGCYDMICPGFVQTSKDLALGSVIYFNSKSPHSITLSISWDQDTDSWWLQYGEEDILGYWPSNLFSYIYNSASVVLWGGEVYSTRLKTPHTATWMGSGRFALSPGSCSMSSIRIRDNSLVWKYPEWTSTYYNQYKCYDAFNAAEGHPDPVFYFGGPGRSPNCP